MPSRTKVEVRHPLDCKVTAGFPQIKKSYNANGSGTANAEARTFHSNENCHNAVWTKEVKATTASHTMATHKRPVQYAEARNVPAPYAANAQVRLIFLTAATTTTQAPALQTP
jgi:hypothetical protein